MYSFYVYYIYKKIKDRKKMTYEQILINKQILKSSLSQLINAAEELENLSLTIKKPSFFAAERERIRTRLYDYILNGYSYDFAKNRLSSEFKTSENIINQICREYYAYHLSQLRPMKIYAAAVLKSAGHTNKQIAQILSITAPTVLKYLTISKKKAA